MRSLWVYLVLILKIFVQPVKMRLWLPARHPWRVAVTGYRTRMPFTLIQAPRLTAVSQAKQEEVYPHVYQSGKAGSSISIFGTKFALPAGTVREEHSDYEETIIPVPKAAPVRAGERRVMIEEMDNLARGAFKV